MAKPKTQLDYKSLKTELDDVMRELQSTDLDVDVALKLYKRGLELVEQLEKYLESAENSVQEIKAKFNTSSGK